MPKVDLSDLLEYCSENISKRQSDLITTEESLLDLLEKRDLIDRAELEIRQPLTTLKIKEGINKYNPTIDNLQNMYALQRERFEEEMKLSLAKAQVSRNGEKFNNNINSCLTNNTRSQEDYSNNATLFKERKNWIYKEISLEIGKQWRNFGRGIGMREGEMDSLEISCHGVQERVYKMLAKLEDNEFNNLEKIYYKIIQSLEETCNRRKLSEKFKSSMIR